MRIGNKWLIIAAFFLPVLGLQTPAFSSPREAQRAGFQGRVIRVDRDSHRGGDRDFRGGFQRGFDNDDGFYRGGLYPGYGFSLGFGWGDPWYGYPYDYPYYYPYPYYSGPNVLELNHINYGTVQFDVRPKTTQVYVDQKYMGEVRDLNHQKAYLPGGYHELKLVAPDGQSIARSVYVPVGRTIRIDERL